MNKRSQTLLLSLCMPGLGYLQIGDKRSFYKTIFFFFAVIFLGALLRLFVSFWGLFAIIISLTTIYFLAVVRSVRRTRGERPNIQIPGLLKLCFTIAFILITALTFANRRTMMGFDIMSMSVPVMQPTVLQHERFLVDTWIYKKKLPRRNDVVAHSFNGQPGIYLNRIIGVGNDRIEIKNGVVLLNDRAITEPYVLAANVIQVRSRDMPGLLIPTGHYFVMGDNRDASFGDSRFSGTITVKNIVGKVTEVILSPDRSRIGLRL